MLFEQPRFQCQWGIPAFMGAIEATLRRAYLGSLVAVGQQDVLGLQVVVHLRRHTCRPAGENRLPGQHMQAGSQSTAASGQALAQGTPLGMGQHHMGMGQHHMLGVQEGEAARDVERDAAAAPPPAERVRCAAAIRAALQGGEEVSALRFS